MWRSKILDPIHYGWHAGDDGTTLYPTTLTAGVCCTAHKYSTPAPVYAPPAVRVLLGDVGAWQLKCHVQCPAVAMLDHTVVTNRPGQYLVIRPRRRNTMFEKLLE